MEVGTVVAVVVGLIASGWVLQTFLAKALKHGSAPVPRRIFLLATAMAATLLPSSAQAGTTVGGMLTSDTTWSTGGSPYLITSTVQIPEGVTLTIDPGVQVRASTGLTDMFLVHGTLTAIGNSSLRISFDGAGSANFFSARSSSGSMLVHVEHADISDGRSLWPPTGYEQYGRLILRHSMISDLTYYSYIWYPEQDVFIEYNTFVNSMGFSIGHGAGAAANVKVYLRWNRFMSLGQGNSGYPAWITNWASYASSQTVVNRNAFGPVPSGKYVLYLPPGYDNAAMDGTSNYWGTTDDSLIASRIYDMNDDITVSSAIPYSPALSSVPAGVPPEPKRAVSVSKIGSGSGTVKSEPSGIDCGSTCSAEFGMSEMVTLTAIPEADAYFTGWTGACNGWSPTCSLSMDSARNVTATFELKQYQYARAVTLALKRHLKAQGTLTSDGPPSCFASVPVEIQKRVSGNWKPLNTTNTTEAGSFKVALADKAGRYRAVVEPVTVDAQNTCLAVESDIAVHRH